MDGLGVPLVTPFDEDGGVDQDRLRELVAWVTDRGVDFLVPCGSTSEAPLLSVDERTRVIDVVADAADVPVLAGTGHAGYRETVRQTRRAVEAGADAALVVTPYYYSHGQDALAAYYREVADAVDCPVYLYSVPKFTHVALDPGPVEELAGHENVAGMKDSSGDLEALQRTYRRAADFDLLVGSGSVFAHGLAAGADGGILALANVAPDAASDVYDRHEAGDGTAARELNADLVNLNRAITAEYGVPGLKAAMRMRGAPAGYPRRPFRSVDEAAEAELADLLDDAGLS
ncbi:dihydrodipicolinate synthase family protein [Halobacteriales archaeon QS_1_68_20]|nr:MAG: dihydrodipicolinate synthase family protein [Halobacteriales archaeon QS_1_68_20]